MNYKDLDCWKLAMELVNSVYSITSTFPGVEKFALRTQMNRAVISIPSNIAEGCARNSDKDIVKFLYIALGSVSELETQLIIAENLKYLSNQKDIYDKKLLSKIYKEVLKFDQKNTNNPIKNGPRP